MSAEEATRTLHERLPGTFIVRSRNADTPDAFTAPFALSVRYALCAYYIEFYTVTISCNCS